MTVPARQAGAAGGPAVLAVVALLVHLAAAAWIASRGLSALHDAIAAHEGVGTPFLEPPLRRFLVLAALTPPVAATVTGAVVWSTRPLWWRRRSTAVAWGIAAGVAVLALDSVARAAAWRRGVGTIIGDVVGRVTSSPLDVAALAEWMPRGVGDALAAASWGVNAAALLAVVCWGLAIARAWDRPRWWTPAASAAVIGAVFLGVEVATRWSAPVVVPRLLRLLA